ncbi:MAG TPA: sigma-70 family RNA polymerase sigma factor [Aeromicrobium sp.]|nr:sigma-70 family RNA polymerase sigma factor [Aeromicrobium sp.]
MTDELTQLARAQVGDRDAFAGLYDRHARPVYWQAYAVVRDRDLAEDVTQDVFVTTWRRIRSITPVDGSILPWLLVTARYTAYNAARKEQRRSADGLDGDPIGGSGADTEVENAMIQAEIDKAVAALSPVDQQLYALCVDGGATYEQAAAELGVSHSVVRNRIHRLRTRLRADLSALRGIA